MAIKKPIPISFNLDSHNSVQSVCAVIHIDDKNTETLDLSLMQGGEHIAVSPNSTVTARFVRVKDKILISDNVPCTVQENGNIHIPIDNVAAHMLVGEIKIEVNIVDESDILTMQFPLVIRVNNTILADAEISPESEGTIPELLEEAREAAESATQAAEAATEAISAKQDKLTAGDNITIEGNVISAEGGGVTSYNDLTDKPAIKTWNTPEYPLNGLLEFDNVFRVWNYTQEGRNIILLSLQGIRPFMLYSWENYLIGVYINDDIQYDFNSVNRAGYANTEKSGHFCCLGKNLTNVPQEFSASISDNSKVMIIHYYTSQPTTDYTYFLRMVYFQDIASSKIRVFAQWVYVVPEEDVSVIYPITVWQEIGGGSQIVSGVVNVNGTITFTDSEGNSFTTSGESVIGADGFSPSATVQQTASGATITVTDKNGTTTANISNGQDGNDYVLTAQDKDDIADIVLAEFTGSIVNGELNTR